MKRREFLVNTARGLGAAWVASKLSSDNSAWAIDQPPLPQKFNAHDTVTLGATGIKTSRLAMGTGTHGFAKSSDQVRLGMAPLTALLLNGYENGLRFFDTADSYGSHPYVASALKQIPRDKVVVMTKSDTRDPAGMKAALDRYRRELGIDYIDIVLMHCMMEGDWTTRYRDTMDVLSEAKEKGVLRAHGCSCHTLEALRAAAASPWVEVGLHVLRVARVGLCHHNDLVARNLLERGGDVRVAAVGVGGVKEAQAVFITIEQ